MEKEKSNKGLIVVLVIIIVALICGLVYVLLNYTKKTENGGGSTTVTTESTSKVTSEIGENIITMPSNQTAYDKTYNIALNNSTGKVEIINTVTQDKNDTTYNDYIISIKLNDKEVYTETCSNPFDGCENSIVGIAIYNESNFVTLVTKKSQGWKLNTETATFYDENGSKKGTVDSYYVNDGISFDGENIYSYANENAQADTSTDTVNAYKYKTILNGTSTKLELYGKLSRSTGEKVTN